MLEPEPGTFDDEGVRWRISSFSGGGSCVAVARVDKDTIAVRSSKRPDGGSVAFTCGEIAAFLQGVKAGEFDDFAG